MKLNNFDPKHLRDAAQILQEKLYKLEKVEEPIFVPIKKTSWFKRVLDLILK